MKLEFKDPWNMVWLENANGWIDLVKQTLDSSDPLYGKDIFVSGIHESKKFLLIENDTDNNYGIVSIERKSKTNKSTFKTIEQIYSIENLAVRLKQDHEQWLKHFV
jgi:ABC-type metal ion transport system substrate-binding protein